MKLAIMQPYFLPYVGYFQLIGAVDMFIIYDNIKYTKKGWINRNRMLRNGSDAMFSLPLKRDSDYLDVVKRQLAADYDRTKLLNQFKGAYLRAPFFADTFPLLERIVCHEDQNLFGYIPHAILCSCEHLGITTKIRTSSEIAIDHELKNQDKVIALCKAVEADVYINSIGGTDLYAGDDFKERDISLKFMQANTFEYLQFGAPFVPWLSIVDVLMFNSLDVVRTNILGRYELS